MNLHVHHRGPASTQAAEGMPRRAWKIDEIEAMVRAGIIAENERFELIGGEIVPMSPKGIWHENVKRALAKHWYKALPPDLELLTETTLRIAPTEFREPDFLLWPSAVPVAELSPAHVMLAVEVADSSLDYDLGAKAAFYASLGLRDYWVVDAKRLVTRIHREPEAGGYAVTTDFGPDARLVPLLLSGLAVTLTDLGLKPLV